MKTREFGELLDYMDESADRIPGFLGAVPIDTDGNVLPAIVAGCLVYFACGESSILRVNEHMAFTDVVLEDQPVQPSAKPEPKRLESVTRPSNCREALREAGQPYPRSGCNVCNHGGMFGCPYEKQPASERGRVAPLDNK